MLHRRFLGAFALCASLLVSLPAAAQSYLQCVPFARSESGVEIRGNAKTWWAQAAGEYKRGHEPRKGAVMAFAATRGMPLGHVAVDIYFGVVQPGHFQGKVHDAIVGLYVAL